MTTDEAPTHLKKRKPRLIEPPPAEHLLAVVEAVLFVADAPLEVGALARVIAAPKAEVDKALDALAEQCRDRGVRLQRIGDLVQLVSASHTAAYVERFLSPVDYERLYTAAIDAA